MAVSLDMAVIGTWRQLLPQVNHMLDKAEAHCRALGLDDSAITDARLADDMWPFAKQVVETAHHSAKALDGVRAGVFGPELDPAPLDFAILRKHIAEAQAVIDGAAPGELDDIAQRDMRFEFGTFRRDFTVEDFLLSFSLPNFQFHVTTMYAILRHNGVKIGKTDFLGKMRTKPTT